MLNQRIELAVTLTFVIAILLGLFLTSRIDLAFSSDLETFSGPRAYPGLILSVLLALIVLVGANQIRKLVRNSDQGSEHEPFFDRRAILSASLFASLVVFVLTFERIGYILTMVPLLILVALLCGARSAPRVVLAAVGFAAVCLVIFRYGLATILPEGLLGIDALF